MEGQGELLAQAQAAPEEAPRSKLENYTAAIFELRGKRWTYEAIADWLKEHGVEVAPSSVFRFCRSRKRAGAPPATKTTPDSSPTQPTPQLASEPTTKRKRRFNLPI